MTFALFLFGAAFGSFIGVIADRYQPENFLFSRKALGGRSCCSLCGKTLRWSELIPVLSFVVQRGRCRACGAGLSFKYPAVEILSGLIFVFVPLAVGNIYYLSPISIYPLSALWISAFLVLLIITLIDLRLFIIPDEASALLTVIGIFIVFLSQPAFELVSGSFVGPYAMLFGLRSNIWTNHLLAAAFGGAFFAFIIIITRGGGMGMGDLKFAVPLGFLFGWPDIILVAALAFIMGSVYGIWAMIKEGKNLKSVLPFGPFLAVSSAVVFFFGRDIVDWYFRLFPL